MPTRVKVDPRTANPTHHISISDGVQTWGLLLEDGVRGIQESPQTSSTLLTNSQGGKFGDYDPSMSHIQQSTFAGGRGGENFSDDNTRYYDSKSMWTGVDDSIFPSLQWKLATGYRNQDMRQLSTNYNWKTLIGIRYSINFAASASYDADRAYLWVRKVGAPGTLTLTLNADGTGGGAGKPGTVAKTATITDATVARNIVTFQPFDWTTTQALTSGTKYHLVVYGAATDNTDNHWEVMTFNETASTDAYTSVDSGTTWAATAYKLYYRVVDAEISRTWKLFQFAPTQMYAVSIPSTGTSQVFSETSAVFSEIATTGLTLVSDVAVSNNVAYFAQGQSVNVRRTNGTLWADDGTNKADLLYKYYDPVDGPQIWAANAAGATIQRASAVDWGTSLTLGTAIKIGDKTYPITGMCGYNDALWTFKQDSVWSVRADRPSKLDVGIDDAASASNGAACVAHGLFLYFSFLGGMERLYAGTLDDVGPDRGSGLPTGRTGVISSLESVMGDLLVAVNAGTGTSSVFKFDGINYHEIFRAPEAGKAITQIKWQSRTSTTNPILWIACGCDIYYMTFPLNTVNPLRDNTVYVMPEAHLITSTYDMNAARLPKLFRQMTVITRNLATSLNSSNYSRSTNINQDSRIGLDYQCDDDIGTDNWVYVGDFLTSPSALLYINQGKRYSIRFRFRFLVSDPLNPPAILATVMEGVARTPVKYQWVLRVRLSSIQSTLTGAPDHDPDNFLKWLQDKAGQAEKLTMHSTVVTMNEKVVLSDPPSVTREFANPILKNWGGFLVMVLREA